MRVEGKLHWVHSASTKTLTHYTCHPNRGKKGSDAAGVLPSFAGTAVHDAWCSYGQYACQHALCNAHHLRELIPFAEAGEIWAQAMITLLLEIKTAVECAHVNLNCYKSPPRPSSSISREEQDEDEDEKSADQPVKQK